MHPGDPAVVPKEASAVQYGGIYETAERLTRRFATTASCALLPRSMKSELLPVPKEKNGQRRDNAEGTCYANTCIMLNNVHVNSVSRVEV